MLVQSVATGDTIALVTSPDHPWAEQTSGAARLLCEAKWSKRELECEFKPALFERAVLSAPKCRQW
jgi:hypothetical protein